MTTAVCSLAIREWYLMEEVQKYVPIQVTSTRLCNRNLQDKMNQDEDKMKQNQYYYKYITPRPLLGLVDTGNLETSLNSKTGRRTNHP